MDKKLHPTKSIRTLDDLKQLKLINPADIPALEKVVDGFSLQISSQMIGLIDPNDINDPIAKQFIPSIEELTSSPYERDDPIGDNAHTTVKGIIHRYPDRCLFAPVHICPIYCRFCFRKEKVSSPSETLTPKELENAYAYIAENKEIWEVILTGGDPFILKPASLKVILSKLSTIEHIGIIRIHTRVPVVDPKRMSAEMCLALKCDKPIYVVLHSNHPKEFTPDAIKACAALVEAGIPMLSQTTLLKNVNDDIDVLSTLMRCFIKNRIKPYYLHHADLVRGTRHFRTSIEGGLALMKQLRGRFSGICQPTYVLDIPGGFGKMPLGPNYLNQNQNGYCVEDYKGNFHHYTEDVSSIEG